MRSAIPLCESKSKFLGFKAFSCELSNLRASLDSPAVQFCGYSLPHPSEAKINIRVQTREGTPAVDAFRTGLHHLVEMAEHIDSVYDAALASFDAAAAGQAAAAALAPSTKQGRKKTAQ